MLRATELTLQVSGKAVFPVWHVGLQVRERERLAVVGESGGGKTSLAWALMGMPLPGQAVVAGSVDFAGVNLLALAAEERARLYYRDIALVPQNAQSVFHPTRRLWKSAGEVMAKGRQGSLSHEQVLEEIAPLSAALDLPITCWDHFPHQLSGGQKQRMNLLLALINDPRVVVLDEPSSALDELTRNRLLRFLDDWASSHSVSMAVFTHDIGMASNWAGRILVLYRGEVVEELPQARFADPCHPYTQGLIATTVRLGDAPLSRPGIPGYAVPRSAAVAGCSFFERCPRARPWCGRETPRLLPQEGGKVRCFL